MKKVILMFLMLVISLSFTLAMSGSGTEGDPYQVTNCIDLQDMEDNTTATYILVNNIDCSDTINWNGGLGFNPINTSFTGSIDGNDKTISDLYINRPLTNYNALIYKFDNPDSYIKDLNIDGFLIYGKIYTSTLVSHANSGPDFSNIHATNIELHGTTQTGIIFGVGGKDSDLSNISTEGIAIGTRYVGGIGGYCQGTNITDSYSNANLTASLYDVGGICGQIETSAHGVIINNVYYSGTISSPGRRSPLIGYCGSSGHTISNSYYDNQTIGSVPHCDILTITSACQYMCSDYYSKNTSDMQTESTYTDWDFINTWIVNEGVDYPRLYSEGINVPVVLLVDPDHNTRNNIPGLNITFSVTDVDDPELTCYLYVNNAIVDGPVLVNSGNQYTFEYVFDVGVNTYKVQCTDGEWSTESEILMYDYDNTTPYITSEYPNTFNTTEYLTSPILVRGNITDNSLGRVNLTVYDPEGTVFWNDYQNFSNQTNYSWEELLVVGNDTDGTWSMHIESADMEQISELPGLNPADIWISFDVDICQESFECTSYGACTELNLQYCDQVTDTSGCSETYSGTGSEFVQVCIYQESMGGGSGGGAFPSDPPSLLKINQTAVFTVTSFDTGWPQWLRDIIDFFKNDWGEWI